MTVIDTIFPRFTRPKKASINPECDRAVQHWLKQIRLSFALRGRAVAGVLFDTDTTQLRLKITDNGREFRQVSIDPQTLNFNIGPVPPNALWLKLHYRWMRIDRVQWRPRLLSIQYTGEWTSFINVKRSKNGHWHLWLPF